MLAVGAAAVLATGANAFVYPYALPSYDNTWPAASALLFVLAFALTGRLLRSAQTAPDRAPGAIRSPRTTPDTSAGLPVGRR